MPGNGELQVGDFVSFALGARRVQAKVIENRGRLGVRGRQLVGIQLVEDLVDEEPRRFEMPAAGLTLEQAAA